MRAHPSTRGPLLANAATRVLIAAIAVLSLWGAVLWAYLAPPPLTTGERQQGPPGLHLVVASGQPAPSGGNFDRFDV